MLVRYFFDDGVPPCAFSVPNCSTPTDGPEQLAHYSIPIDYCKSKPEVSIGRCGRRHVLSYKFDLVLDYFLKQQQKIADMDQLQKSSTGAAYEVMSAVSRICLLEEWQQVVNCLLDRGRARPNSAGCGFPPR